MGKAWLAAASAITVSLAGLAPVLAATSPSDPLPVSPTLPNGWALQPAGTQVLTNRAPTGLVVSPDGSSVYATTSGIFDEAVVHIDATTLEPTPTLVSDAFQGVAADASGNVWVSGGPADRVWQYQAAGPALVDERQAGAAPDTPNRGIPVTGYPGDMVLAGNRLFVSGTISVPSSVAAQADAGQACPGGSSICSVVNVVDASQPSTASPAVAAVPVGRDAVGLAWRPSSSTVYVANFADQTNPARSGGAGTGTVSVVKMTSTSGREVQVVPVGLGPDGVALSPDGRTLAVADSGSDELSVLSLNPAGSVTATSTVDLRVAPGAALGTEPLAVAFSPNGTSLYVTLAGIDAVEVLSVSNGQVAAIPQMVSVPGAERLRVPATFIPTGWYPDALTLAQKPGTNAERLYVANLRGQGSGPGLYEQLEPVSGSNTEGSVSAIDLPSSSKTLSYQLNQWTADVVANDQLASLYDRSMKDPATDACLPAPIASGGIASSALLCEAQRHQLDPRNLHVVIIEAENKTFDSYFGDISPELSNANANPAFTEFGQAVTTNQHALAETFGLDDNFYNEGAESSVLGHSWLSGAYTTADNELTWGMDYGQGLRGNRSGGEYAPSSLASGSATSASVSGPSSPAVAAQEAVMLDPANLLTDEALASGLSVRLFGTDSRPGDPVIADGYQVPQKYWGESGSDVSSDLAWPDADRAAIFLHGTTVSHAWDMFDGPTPPAQFGTQISLSLADKQKFTLDGWTNSYKACTAGGRSDSSCQFAMPNLVYMQLPENHTYVVSNVFNPLDPTPQSMVADNDYAIGEIVAGLSKSPFWKNTLVMITEDDNQFTGDHVDIHRTFVLTAGGMAEPIGKAGKVADQRGSFPSIDKTAEVLLGLPAMTLFDARAIPLQQLVANRIGTGPANFNAVDPPTPFLGSGTPAGSGLTSTGSGRISSQSSSSPSQLGRTAS